ncbi:AGAP006005-PA-like protein [Anopheles sinensis]|uniref:AGAP006005-PA-like protein n=1 Tax=Anopheles sinensis TaxID=74873 RepID=A0A084W0T4_ANOSI|nr:AGAP006005-PA-like protein [Anopheles sinensis]
MNKETVCHLVIIVNLFLSISARPTEEVGHNFDRFEVTSDQHGGQSFSYKTKDGQWRDETVEVDAVTGKLGHIRLVSVRRYGLARFYQVKYVADENGFRPLGTHLPGADLSDPSVFGVFTPLADGISKTVLLSLVG